MMMVSLEVDVNASNKDAWNGISIKDRSTSRENQGLHIQFQPILH